MMTDIDNECIQTLIDKFFAGETTVDEEHRLYRYFSRDDVAARWQPYRRLFLHFAALPACCAAPVRPVRQSRRSRPGLRVAAAAVLAFLLAVGGKTLVDSRQEQVLRQHYAGSYVMENGRRIDDLRSIYPEIESTLQQADRIERHIAQSDPVEEAEREVLRHINDPERRQQVRQMMNAQTNGIQ